MTNNTTNETGENITFTIFRFKNYDSRSIPDIDDKIAIKDVFHYDFQLANKTFEDYLAHYGVSRDCVEEPIMQEEKERGVVIVDMSYFSRELRDRLIERRFELKRNRVYPEKPKFKPIRTI